MMKIEPSPASSLERITCSPAEALPLFAAAPRISIIVRIGDVGDHKYVVVPLERMAAAKLLAAAEVPALALSRCRDDNAIYILTV